MRSFKTEGIIIKRRDFGEADRYVTIFTKYHGKIHAKALGVRKLISRRSPHIELLNHAQLTLHKGLNNPILTEAQSIETYPLLRENLTKIGFAYHICELVDGLCPENQENKIVFWLLKDILHDLSSSAVEEIAPVVHSFEVSLLTNLGFWPKNRVLAAPDTQAVIERILEKKLRSKKFLSKLS